MGKTFKHNQYLIEEAKQKQLESLRAATRAINSRTAVATASKHYEMYGVVRSYSSHIINDPKTWTNTLKSKNHEKILLSLIRHSFARYKVPSFLEDTWTTYQVDKMGNPIFPRNQVRGAIDYRQWYICVAQGGSLYKEHGRYYGLSRADIHNFLTCPQKNIDVVAAVWYGIAKSKGANPKIAIMISRCKLASTNFENEFNKNLIGWFIHHQPDNVAQMNDMIDYINHRVAIGEGNFNMKGRTKESILQGVKDWHYALARMKNIGGGNWEGLPVLDSDIAMGPEDDRQVWHFVQIKTGDRLAQEGTKMRHCVSSYKSHCVSGHTAIWAASMTYKNKTKDYLTIQVNITGNNYTIVQVRGLANRAPNSYERSMVKLWANREGLLYNTSHY